MAVFHSILLHVVAFKVREGQCPAVANCYADGAVCWCRLNRLSLTDRGS